MKALMIRFIKSLHLTLYRLSGGAILDKLVGMPVMLLHSVGRKTGRKRTIPITYFTDGDNYILTASNGGGPHNPGWYYNLQAHPQTTIQLKRAIIPVMAEVAGPKQRKRLWAELNTIAQVYSRYQTKTSRQIPMIILRPLG